MSHINKVAHVVLRVSNVEEAVTFYRDILGMETVRYDTEAGMAFMSFGTQHHDIGLFSVRDEATRGNLGLAHVAMVVDGDLADLKVMHDKLLANGTDVRLADHGMTKSVYFQDPDGNGLELFVESMSQKDGKKYLSERVGRGMRTFTFAKQGTETFTGAEEFLAVQS